MARPHIQQSRTRRTRTQRRRRGLERLQACVFKLPVNGEMVSMCEMNATDLRRKLNLQQLNGRGAGRSAANRTA